MGMESLAKSKTDTLVDAMLLALEAEGTGTKEQKMERLRMQMGLTPKPV